jgi:uncharacterized protein (TIGR02145 family)
MKTKFFRKNRSTDNGNRRMAHVGAKNFSPLRAICMMMLCSATLSAQNGVTVSNILVTNGLPTTVTFEVNWKNTDLPAVWSDSVWVFVDYNDAGTMKRLPLLPGATLTATSAPGVGRVEYAANNNKGVWVIGNARSAGSFGATVKLLTANATAAGACAYASNYPPVGQFNSGVDISFTGTAPYEIVMEHEDGGTIVRKADSPYSVPASYTVQSFSDATGAPGVFKCRPMTGDIDFSVTPAVVAKGQAVSFAVSIVPSSPVASAITYTWSAPNFSPASHSGTPFNVTVPAVGGNYPVTLTARSTGFCDLTKSKNVLVSDCIPPATFTLTASASGFCAGGAGVTFGLSGTEIGRNYQLYRGATPVGVLNGTGSAATFSGTFNVAGNYTAQAMADGAYCAVPMSGSHHISENPTPTSPTISSSGDVCQNVGNIEFTATGYTGTLEWVSNGGGAESGNTITFTSTSTGAKAVTARSSQTYTNAPTCYSASVSKSATVNPTPTVASSAGDSRCGQGTLTLSATPSSGAVIDWYNAATGGAVLPGGSATNSFITPSVSTSTTYYAEAQIAATGCVSAPRTAVLATVNTVPAVPAMGGGGSQCGGSLNITAIAGSGGNGIRWTDNSSTISPRNVTTSGTYYAVTTSATDCESGQASVVATIHAVPAITCTDGNASQSVTRGTAISTITHTAANATSIAQSSGSFPDGLNGAASGTTFTISGTPSATGTFNYELTASHTNGCTSAASSGTITVIPDTPPGAASTRTWTIGNQTWSDAIRALPSECQVTTSMGSTTPQYFTNVSVAGSGYLYNHLCVYTAAAVLCPDPWRVPENEDFVTLDRAMGGTGANRTNRSFVQDKYRDTWGSVFAGHLNGASVNNANERAIYWTKSLAEIGAYNPNWYITTGRIILDRIDNRRFGQQVRCVK